MIPCVLKETASGLFAYVFIIFIAVIIWWLSEDSAKPTDTALSRLSEAAAHVREPADARTFPYMEPQRHLAIPSFPPVTATQGRASPGLGPQLPVLDGLPFAFTFPLSLTRTFHFARALRFPKHMLLNTFFLPACTKLIPDFNIFQCYSLYMNSPLLSSSASLPG